MTFIRRNSILPKGQLAHDLALLALSKEIGRVEATDEIYDRYMELLLEFSTLVDDRTRYELRSRKWMEAAPLGKSEFDVDESLL